MLISYDGPLLVLNFAWLLAIVVIPFSTAITQGQAVHDRFCGGSTSNQYDDPSPILDSQATPTAITSGPMVIGTYLAGPTVELPAATTDMFRRHCGRQPRRRSLPMRGTGTWCTSSLWRRATVMT